MRIIRLLGSKRSASSQYPPERPGTLTTSAATMQPSGLAEPAIFRRAAVFGLPGGSQDRWPRPNRPARGSRARSRWRWATSTSASCSWPARRSASPTGPARSSRPHPTASSSATPAPSAASSSPSTVNRSNPWAWPRTAGGRPPSSGAPARPREPAFSSSGAVRSNRVWRADRAAEPPRPSEVDHRPTWTSAPTSPTSSRSRRAGPGHRAAAASRCSRATCGCPGCSARSSGNRWSPPSRTARASCSSTRTASPGPSRCPPATSVTARWSVAVALGAEWLGRSLGPLTEDSSRARQTSWIDAAATIDTDDSALARAYRRSLSGHQLAPPVRPHGREETGGRGGRAVVHDAVRAGLAVDLVHGPAGRSHACARRARGVGRAARRRHQLPDRGGARPDHARDPLRGRQHAGPRGGHDLLRLGRRHAVVRRGARRAGTVGTPAGARRQAPPPCRPGAGLDRGLR